MQVPDALSRVENAPLLDANAEESLNENDPNFPYEVEEVGKISFVNFANLSADEIHTGYTADTEEESSKLTFKQESIDGIDCNFTNIQHSSSDVDGSENNSILQRHPTDLFDVCGKDCISDCACDTLFVNKYENVTDNLRIDDFTLILQRHPIDFTDLCETDCDETGDSLYLHAYESGFDTEFTKVQDINFVGTADKSRDQSIDFKRENIKHLQRIDETLLPIILYLENGILPKLQKEARRLLLKAPDYSMIDDLLFRSRVAKSKRTQRMGEFQLVIPKQLIPKIFEIYHQTPLAGHMGIQQTVDNISQQFYFQNLPSTVSSYVRSCHDCQERKMTKAHTKSEIISFRTPTELFQTWQVDLFGPLPITQKGNAYVFTAVDMFSKLLFCVPLLNSHSVTMSHRFSIISVKPEQTLNEIENGAITNSEPTSNVVVSDEPNSESPVNNNSRTRPVRQIRKPMRYRSELGNISETTVADTSSSEQTDNIFYKIKRILAKRKRNECYSYLLVFAVSLCFGIN
ncbi:unnamed protein product [Mytilus coruscus]|uniref:Integrase zinc-binding domain-containing protein n=1 Tax=Mytilus coruscus TaxID=42192 RepID=A0A6J8E385_MYTCO|nr:unnamed protein product [Mytilus coruscus]